MCSGAGVISRIKGHGACPVSEFSGTWARAGVCSRKRSSTDVCFFPIQSEKNLVLSAEKRNQKCRVGGVGADWAGTGGLYLAGAGRKDTFVPTGAFCFLAHQYRRSGIPDEKKEHLEAMLNSVSRQSYPHWELIVADAGDTAESVQDWAKKERNLPAESGRCIKSCRMEGSEHRAQHPFREQRNFRQYERRN